MSHPGAVVLYRFPQTNQQAGKIRPAVLLGRLPGGYDDWLICMVSSQLRHYLPDFDELVRSGDVDFVASGLRNESVIRVGRVAVVEEAILLGEIGRIAPERLKHIVSRLADWLVRQAT
jgi:mRNA interferase MazF